jgi:hypothetical protein
MARPAFSARILQIVKNFDNLPDDAVVPLAVIAAMGGPSERSLRRSAPVRKVQLSERYSGLRVGDWRKLVRGEKPAA